MSSTTCQLHIEFKNAHANDISASLLGLDPLERRLFAPSLHSRPLLNFTSKKNNILSISIAINLLLDRIIRQKYAYFSLRQEIKE